MNLIMGVIKSIRNIRNEMKVNPGKRIKAILNSPEEKKSILNEGYEYIRNLAGLSELIIEVDLQENRLKFLLLYLVEWRLFSSGGYD